jgi:hypothetical protein
MSFGLSISSVGTEKWHCIKQNKTGESYCGIKINTAEKRTLRKVLGWYYKDLCWTCISIRWKRKSTDEIMEYLRLSKNPFNSVISATKRKAREDTQRKIGQIETVIENNVEKEVEKLVPLRIRRKYNKKSEKKQKKKAKNPKIVRKRRGKVWKVSKTEKMEYLYDLIDAGVSDIDVIAYIIDVSRNSAMSYRTELIKNNRILKIPNLADMRIVSYVAVG